MYTRNLIQLLLRPELAWEEIARQNASPALLMRNGFYRLMSLVAITAFVRGLYAEGQTFTVASALQGALVQFIALFLSLGIARSALDVVMARFGSDAETRRRIDTMAIYSISLMAVIQAVVNLCPVDHILLSMLPAFVVIVVWNTRKYMQIKDNETLAYMITAQLSLITVPLILNYTLSLII